MTGARPPLALAGVATRVWQGIETIDPPLMHTDYPALLAVARNMLETRRTRFPALVRAGRMSAEAAAAEIATFDAIVADWQWICTGAGEPASRATLQARRDALDASLCTIAEIAREHGGFPEQLGAPAEAVIAMRWHLEPGRETHALANLSRKARAQALQQETASA